MPPIELDCSIDATGRTVELGEVQAKWTQMLAGLDAVSRKDIVVDFIRYMWIAKHGHVRGKELYTKIKGKVKEQGGAIELVNDLAECANIYAAMLNSDHPKWDEYGEETKIDLSNLISLGIERIHPITLAMLEPISQQSVECDEGAGEGDESVEALDGLFEAGDGAAVAVEPSEGAFDLPAAFVPAEFAAVVGGCLFAVLAVRGDEVDAPFGERRAEGSES